MLKSFSKAIGLGKKYKFLNEWRAHIPLTYSLVISEPQIEPLF